MRISSNSSQITQNNHFAGFAYPYISPILLKYYAYMLYNLLLQLHQATVSNTLKDTNKFYDAVTVYSPLSANHK